MASHPDDPFFSVNAPHRRTRPTAALLYVGGAVAFLAVCYMLLPGELPWYLQKPLGIAFAVLVALAAMAVTRPRETPEEILYRMRRGQHSDFGKQLLLQRPKPKVLKVPGVGDVSLRSVGAGCIAALALLWWFTPLAPIKVSRAQVGDLTQLFGEEIAAAVLAMPNPQMALPQPPLIRARARREARIIPNDADHFLSGLRSIAEARHDDARLWLRAATHSDVAEAGQVALAQAQNEMFAGKFLAAGALYESALQDERLGDDPLVLCQAAVAWFQNGDFAKSEALLNKAAKVAGDEGLGRAAVLHGRALLAVAQGKDLANAQNLCRKSREALPEDARDASPFMPASLNNQAAIGMIRGGYQGSEELFRAARDHWVWQEGEQHPLTATADSNLGVLDLVMGRYALAGTRIHEALALLPEAQPLSRSATLNAAALQHVAVCQLDEARKDGKESLTIIGNELGMEHRSVVGALFALGRVRLAESRYVQADAKFTDALDTVKKCWANPQHPYVASMLLALADANFEQGRIEKADDYARQAEAVFEKAFDKGHIGAVRARVIRARVALQQDRQRDARPLLADALEAQRKIYGDKHPTVAATMGYLASIDTSPSTYPKGVDQYNRAIKMAEETVGADTPLAARLRVGLARLHIAREKYVEAEKPLVQALAVQEALLVPYHPDLAVTLELYAEVLSKLTPPQSEKAASLRQRAQAVRAKHAAEDRGE